MKFRADRLVELYKSDLVGKILLAPCDNLVTRVVKVSKLLPDPNAPEIVMQVTWGEGENENIGIFEHEYVTLLIDSQKKLT